MDLNISLTAIGLLWNMADFLHRDRAAISKLWTEHPLPSPYESARLTTAELDTKIMDIVNQGIDGNRRVKRLVSRKDCDIPTGKQRVRLPATPTDTISVKKSMQSWSVQCVEGTVDVLWLYLFDQLARLCVDSRPEV